MAKKPKDLTQFTRAQFLPLTLNEESRTIDVVFATPTPVLRYSWYREEYYNEVLDMEGADMSRAGERGLPVLDNHNTWGSVGNTVIGRAQNFRRENDGWVASVRFSEREELTPLINDIRSGIITDISFGYSVNKIERGEKKDGEEYRTYFIRSWTPTEISFVSIPADPRAGVRSEDGNNTDIIAIFERDNPTQNQQNLNQGVIMKREQIIAMLAKRGITVDANISDEALNAELERALTTQGEDPEAVRKAATEAERKRVADITSAVRAAKLPNDFAEKLISEGKSIEESRAAIIEEFAKEDPNKGRSGQRIEVGNDRSAELRAQAVTAGIILRGKPELLRGERKLFTEEVIAEAHREYRGMKLLDLAKDALTRGGIDFKGLNDVEIVGRAFTSSSSDFPVLLEGANRTVLLANYQAASDTWRRFCATGSVSDFREHKRLRMGTFSDLEAIQENGEYKNKKITDADFEKVSVDTKGNIINLTRKMIINDDLSGFLRLPEMLGRAAARSIENDVYALLKEGSGLGPLMADGKRLIHADHKNIATPGAPSVAVLNAMRQQMAVQTDKDGNDFLDIRPQLALSPLALGSTLRELNAMEYNSTAQKEEKRPNVVRGIFNDIIDTPRLTGTAYYMFADPSIEPVLEVNFLNGEQNPYMESEQGFTTDGVRWKIRLDYGVDAIGWRGVIRNAGA